MKLYINVISSKHEIQFEKEQGWIIRLLLQLFLAFLVW